MQKILYHKVLLGKKMYGWSSVFIASSFPDIHYHQKYICIINKLGIYNRNILHEYNGT